MVQKLSLAFRKATRRDLPAISKLFDTALNETKEFDNVRSYMKECMGDPDDSFIVATSGGKLAGFIVTDFKSDSRHAINIDQLAVDASFRHQGIGTALLKKAEEIALTNKFRAVTLQVRADNDNAKRLYEEMGYQKIGSHWHYYGDGMTGYEMKKTLIPDPPHHWLPGFVRKWMGMAV
jgi:ribosomal-protein-alanine N-acetyltransferase